MKNEILIFGKGYFGQHIQKELSAQASERKIFSLSDAEEEINKYQPRIIINCVGYIGSNVDGCELNREKAYEINYGGTENIARACKDADADLIYISTDFVFDGKKNNKRKWF